MSAGPDMSAADTRRAAISVYKGCRLVYIRAHSVTVYFAYLRLLAGSGSHPQLVVCLLE